MQTLILTLVAASVLGGGAASAPPTEDGTISATPATERVDDAIDEVQTALDDALIAAKAYGRNNLGHYRKLDHRRLAAQGFRAGDEVQLRVYATHNDYCFTVSHSALPASNAWQTASINGRTQQPQPGDACAAQVGGADLVASRQSGGARVVRGEGAWVCRLPGDE